LPEAIWAKVRSTEAFYPLLSEVASPLLLPAITCNNSSWWILYRCSSFSFPEVLNTRNPYNPRESLSFCPWVCKDARPWLFTSSYGLWRAECEGEAALRGM